jgi:hypothetical protein
MGDGHIFSSGKRPYPGSRRVQRAAPLAFAVPEHRQMMTMDVCTARRMETMAPRSTPWDRCDPVRSSLSRVLHVAYYQIGIDSTDNRPHTTWPTRERDDNVSCDLWHVRLQRYAPQPQVTAITPV